MTPSSLGGFESLTPITSRATPLATAQLFSDSADPPKTVSPIDEYAENTEALNLLIVGEGRPAYSPRLGSLLLLGHVSAVESYFRALFRRLILDDEYCQRRAEPREISYGAALHHKEELLPEALFESVSLANARTIAMELRRLCGLPGFSREGKPAQELTELFDQFDVICQLRHCCVHRFGRLSGRAAMQFGIDEHRPFIELPLTLTEEQLINIASTLNAFVRAVNTYAFKHLLLETVRRGPGLQRASGVYKRAWELDYEADKERFRRYYDIFASRRAPGASNAPEVVYAEFIAQAKELLRRPKPRDLPGGEEVRKAEGNSAGDG